MLIRVVIVIVVVAVLGFFGTRGSEKVVAEVTERQEIVDELKKQVDALTAEQQALSGALQAAKAAAERSAQERSQEHARLSDRIAELERKETMRELQKAGDAVVDVIIQSGLLVRIDGELLSGPLLGGTALRLAHGPHQLQVEERGRKARYTLEVLHGGEGRLLVTGAMPTTVGGLAIKRVK